MKNSFGVEILPLTDKEAQAGYAALDKLVAYHTAMKSMAELVNSAGCYRPTLDVYNPERKIIADVYDAIQASRGDERRVFRYEQPPRKRLYAQRRPKCVQVGDSLCA